MSTKASIASGPNFHLYTEVFDDAAVLLELEGVEFEATNRHVKVTIPVAVWEVIRAYPGVDLSWADQSDDAIRQFVEAKVKDRLLPAALTDAPPEKLRALIRWNVYGDPSESEAEQVAAGVAYFTRMREQQAKVKQDIADLKRMQRHLPEAP